MAINELVKITLTPTYEVNGANVIFNIKVKGSNLYQGWSEASDVLNISVNNTAVDTIDFVFPASQVDPNDDAFMIAEVDVPYTMNSLNNDDVVTFSIDRLWGDTKSVTISGLSNYSNTYGEYMYINGEFELIGTTRTDLSNYYTKDEVDAKMALLESRITSLENEIADLEGDLNS